ncbi:MAG: tRNA (guanosine(37)-N1)-methyltransferase TrmD [Candidatus Marinimicrobia bacterium]|nr:tRNA (guanosine(37)-N1)-methyltransferase TrmD [Candidatus Neomarinimicrobiota bacterium]MCF7829608.1 tRNA (guanosine(37)-N1)-methyltransferase TrmD [Candidatus Neomarinimicrobiota bacterium]MCF7879768.1 tRNA (guanosine(37)-N1)-methyltransferase TrmD [Candidatus Neomarinimicrobiota bacterium]
MQIDIITAFPEIVSEPLSASIPAQAEKKGLVEYRIHDLRDFTTDKHRQIDDLPYGGGPGMILKPEPLFRAVEALREQCENHSRCEVIYPTPQGTPFTQKSAENLRGLEHLIFICGRYKGIDERVREQLVTMEISLGDFVLSGGEIPALAIIDSTVRLLPGVLQDPESAETDSFSSRLLDGPHYTRPEEFRGLKVPEILLSGHHAKIREWREEQRLTRTRERRSDLLVEK